MHGCGLEFRPREYGNKICAGVKINNKKKHIFRMPASRRGDVCWDTILEYNEGVTVWAARISVLSGSAEDFAHLGVKGT